MEKNIIKECKKHGTVRFVLDTRGTYRCTACRVDYVKVRRLKLKRLAVEYKGEYCQRCGYNKCIGALEFHHLDPSKKDFSISQDGGNARSWSKIKLELDKCIMLCSNCHREVHAEEAPVAQ